MGFGRIYNAVHTYNQVIGGYVWGYIIYYAFVHIFYYEIVKFINTLEKIKGNRLYWNTLTQGFLMTYFVSIVLYLFNSVAHPTPLQWIEGIQRNCKDVDLNIDPEMQNFEKFHLSFSWLGSYIGLLFE